MNESAKQNILISACLLGSPVRYNGTDLLIEHPLLKQWKKENRLISICPEVAGGMPTPRAPAEISDGDGESVLLGNAHVIDNLGKNVTNEFILGANKALEMAQKYNCIAAILTERSPSCGSNIIYDGSFSRAQKSGAGVTATLLIKNGIKVFNQNQLNALRQFLSY